MTAHLQATAVLKGHGTENDFIVLPDLDASVSLSPELVRALCDRHRGLGADGVLRVVRTKLATEPDVQSQADTAEFFMDYHNADGSIAEMCGNGARVFARYLQSIGLADEAITIATRGGPRQVSFLGTDVSVVMGWPQARPETPVVSVNGVRVATVGAALELPNPHVVVTLASLADLYALDLASAAPVVTPSLPDGQNVEFVVVVADHHLKMRVHERGVGETRSCGTGICAAVAAVSGELSAGHPTDSRPWRVDVPGGSCVVSRQSDGQLTLTGPAVLVGEINLNPDWIAAIQTSGQ